MQYKTDTALPTRRSVLPPLWAVQSTFREPGPASSPSLTNPAPLHPAEVTSGAWLSGRSSLCGCPSSAASLASPRLISGSSPPGTFWMKTSSWSEVVVAEVFTVWKQELTKTWENSLFAKMKTIEGNIKETNETMIREIKVISEQLEVLKEGVPICQNCANVNVSGQPSAELLVPPKDRIVLSNQLTPQPESQILKTTPTSDVFTAFSENGPDQTAMDTSDDSAPVEEESAFHYSPVPKSKLSTCHLENVETYAALFSGAPGAGKVSPITEATAAEAAAGDVLGTLENRQKTRERKQKSPTKKKGTVHYHMRDHKHGSTESALCKKMKPMHIRKRQSSAKKVKSTGGDAVISEYPSVVNRKTRIIRSMCHERL
ncbi:uncharacterized protein LOC133360194 isoform X3 [Lethenteron reissneri]|uniref:uncharacterized protein LOC133360194 isoform X3 n=1 Tax=Lethenteron reissneri TaxID=7753 RepID=UPI002AB75541|nr:uncharacterized protein LOC133360194 isoform X3 [Lethenteron reissneri]